MFDVRRKTTQTAEKPARLRRSLFVWGLADQALSSATTFLFTLVAARSLGPSGLGTVTLGFTAYLVMVGVERSLLVDPLLTRMSSARRTSKDALRGAISAALLGGVAIAVLAIAIGLTWAGAGARGMLIFAPWMVPALLQMLLRSWLYRQGRGAIATVSSAVWLLTFVATFAAGFSSSDWNIVAAWGIGGCAALVVSALGTTGVGLAAPRATTQWFREEALSVGMWRTASSIVFSVATYARVAGMSLILGPAAIGGYRAIETVFAPTSMIGPALSNAGIPILRESAQQRSPRTWPLALKISLASAGLALAYIVPVTLARNLVLMLFGESFRGYEDLIPPIAVGALVVAASTGFTVLMLAARKMDQTALIVFINSALMLAIPLPLAAFVGLEAAAWGISIGAVAPVVLLVILARRAALGLDLVKPREAPVVKIQPSA